MTMPNNEDLNILMAALFNDDKLDEKAAAYARQLDRKAVPEEFADRYTPIDIMSGPLGGGLSRVPICNNCGAMVFPTALNRHDKFHRRLRISNISAGTLLCELLKTVDDELGRHAVSNTMLYLAVQDNEHTYPGPYTRSALPEFFAKEDTDAPVPSS